MTATTLGRPLAAYIATVTCDRNHDHEVTLTTDGTRTYATGTLSDTGMTVHREGHVITVSCAHPLPARTIDEADPCEGQADFDLTAQGAWTADAHALATLATYGEMVPV